MELCLEKTHLFNTINISSFKAVVITDYFVINIGTFSEVLLNYMIYFEMWKHALINIGIIFCFMCTCLSISLSECLKYVQFVSMPLQYEQCFLIRISCHLQKYHTNFFLTNLTGFKLFYENMKNGKISVVACIEGGYRVSIFLSMPTNLSCSVGPYLKRKSSY